VTPVLIVKNHGPLVVASNFWELPESKLGKYLVSVNAGAFRLLLPESLEPALDDMRTAKGVAVSRGPWPAQGLDDAIEILFDDGTRDPFALHTATEAFDRLPLDADAGWEWLFTVWTRPRRGRPHKALERACRYRRSARLPDLRSWEDR
jgi:hypothetical protein